MRSYPRQKRSVAALRGRVIALTGGIILLLGSGLLLGGCGGQNTAGTDGTAAVEEAGSETSAAAGADAGGTAYYVSPAGNDDHAGTQAEPFASVARAQEAAESGDTVYLEGGVYRNLQFTAEDDTYHYITKLYKSDITYMALSDEDPPVFDCSGLDTDKRIAAFYVAAGTQNVTIRSVRVTGIPVGEQKQAECFRIEGNASLERITCCDNQAIGFYFTGHGTGRCYCCDAYNDIGVGESIGNIDGFGAHGDGVTFEKCRAWNCSDDGFDCINSRGANTFEDCWAFSMNAGGDSNGFKIGGFGKNVISFEPPVHTVCNCIAADNGAHGFYANHQPGQAAVWTNNRAFHNKKGNFSMLETKDGNTPEDIPGTREELYGNTAWEANALQDAAIPDAHNTGNSWNEQETALTASDFISLDISQLSAPRKADGDLPDITFMQTK